MKVEHTARFLDLLSWFHDQGETVQIGTDALAEAVGIPERSLMRHLRRMEDLNLIVVSRPSSIGAGRECNIYRPLVTAATWKRRSQEALRAEQRAKDRAREAARRAHKSQAKAAQVAAQAAEELRAIVETLDAPDPIIVELEQSVVKKMLGDPSEDDLIDAWLGGSL